MRGVAEVTGDLFEPGPAPGVASFFFEGCRVAEGAHGGIAGVFGAHARGEVFGDLLVEMELDFVVQSLIVRAATEQGL